MGIVFILLAVIAGICTPLWHYARSGASKNDAIFYARICFLAATSLFLITAFFSGLDGLTFREIASADLAGHKSRYNVYLIYFLASCGVSFLVIHAFKRS